MIVLSDCTIYTVAHITAKSNFIGILINTFLQRQSISPPTLPCDSSHEGESYHRAVRAGIIWICNSKEWIPYK